jgi:thioredoxin-disulfide reductase
MSEIRDLIIIGAGPAGLTAALYAGRRSLDTLVITKDIGGQAASTHEIENWPGTEFIDGPTLMNQFHKHAEKFGAEFKFAGVEKIEHDESQNVYHVSTGKDVYTAHAIILAFGLEHRKLGVPGEKEFYGKGITYCATCDGPLFRGKEVCVIGGGNSALDAIDYMSKLATHVHAYVRGDAFKGEDILIRNVERMENVTLHYNTEVTQVHGEQFVNKVSLLNNKTQETSEQELQGVFVEIGFQPNTKLYEELVEMTPQGAIKVNDLAETSRPGFFAAGDITTIPYKQIVTSGGQGCAAALTAYTYIQKKKGLEAQTIIDR